MMEVVQLVEVSGQEHQVMETFEDLILTVVPEGQEAEALAAAGSNDGQRTIVVTEVRNHQEMEDEKTKEIETLHGRVEQLEEQVHFLEDELRLMRRKIQGIPTNSYSAIRRTVLEVLSKQTMKISLSDFEDEMETHDPVGRTRNSAAQKKRKYENGISDDEEDEEFSEDEPLPPVRKRRGPGRPPKSLGRKPKSPRVELTPPPPKISRPRGRPRRLPPKLEQEEVLGGTGVPVENTELNASHADDSVEEDAGVNTTAEMMSAEEEVEQEHIFIAENDLEETEETEDNAEVSANTSVKTEVDGTDGDNGKISKATGDEAKMSPKRGRRRADEKEPESLTPVRVSTRARKTSRKGSD